MMGLFSRARVRRLVCLMMLGALLSLQGCSAYHGQTREQTNTQVRKTVGPGQKSIAVSAREGVLTVERFNLHEVESLPVITTTKVYNKCEYKARFSDASAKGATDPISVVATWIVSGVFGYVFDVFDSSPMCDQPVVPVLSRVACGFLPFVSCGGDPGGPAVTDISTKEGSPTTATERRMVAGLLEIEIKGEHVDVRTDSVGIAQVPLESLVVGALRKGEERFWARVRVRE